MEKVNTDKVLKALCKYYMEFLESDFKRRRAPKRRINIKSNIKKKIDNKIYGNLNSKYLKVLNKKFENTTMLSVIKKNQYTLTLPDEIIDQLADFIYGFPQNIESRIEELNVIDEKETEKKYQEIYDDQIKKILSKCSYIDEAKIEELLKEAKNNEKRIKTYFRNLKVTDLYNELFELWKNKEMTEKEEIYLYFYELKYKNNSYPLFYIQLQLFLNDANEFEVDYSPVLLVNKKALKYISQKYKKEQNKKMQLELPMRKIYLSNYKNENEFVSSLQRIINEITSFFTLNDLDIKKTDMTKVQNHDIEINNKTYFMLFDKSDEAIVNDYEELIKLLDKKEESKSLDILNKLSEDFLFNNPEKYNLELDNSFDKKPVSDKINFDSPIPLNVEQLKILEAVKKDNCSNIVVQGPPGNGKSHTISAIIYNALLNDQSILVLSDKTEALDVVESKITQLLDKVNPDDYIQNPLLRLGKRENNYHKIFNTSNYNKIKTRYHAMNHTSSQIDQEIKNIKNQINTSLKDYIKFEKYLDPEKVNYILKFDDEYQEKWADKLSKDEIIDNNKIEEFIQYCYYINDYLGALNEVKYIVNISDDLFKTSDINSLIGELEGFVNDLKGLSKKVENHGNKLFFKNDIDRSNISLLQYIVEELNEIKIPIIGYLWEKIKGSKNIKKLTYELKKYFINHADFDLLENKRLIEEELSLYEYADKIIELHPDINIDLFNIIRKEKIEEFIFYIDTIKESLKEMRKIEKTIPITIERLNIKNTELQSYNHSFLANIPKEEINKLKEYLKYLSIIRQEENKNFDEFIDDRKSLQNKLIYKMTNILDESVIKFKENNQNDASELKKVIKKKMKISKSYLEKLTKAFPCLIVNIRELGDYLPLEPDLFDIVIIDEASQVSIAQAFPAIIRAGTTVVLGDNKQFSNVKTHYASKDINKVHFNKVKEVFTSELADIDSHDREIYLSKLKNFNVKNSILEFMDRIANYDCLLTKHFRGYKELIQYSNETFYNNSLQIMKIRGKSIDDVVQFHRVNPKDDPELIKNTNVNKTEAKYIFEEVTKLLEENYTGTVGVITPFRDQQKYITNLFYNSSQLREYQHKLKLKIMTFDSCQGEERDIIYYSMVEREEHDNLRYIFPVDFNKLNREKTESLKSQRLNVGLSRTKESIRFVLSKNIEDIRGEIGNALRQFKRYKEEAREEDKLLKNIDGRSPMEKKFLNYLLQTRFYKNNKHRLDIIPQFNIGRYIKQMDPYARIPEYKVDFLLIFYSKENQEETVIIEYDGFEYHFVQNGHVDINNYQEQYVEKDIERQKTIELYGYRFLRFNKFNLGDNPIANIDKRLKNIFKDQIKDNVIENINQHYKKIKNKEEKVCGKCGKVKPIEAFYDDSLKTGVGRYCMECKK